MKRSIPVLLALTIGCATGAAVRDIVAPARAQGQAGPSYEYDIVDYNMWSAKDTVNKYGRQGWRLVQVSNAGFYFERQLPR
jgi:hypothetical protein